MAGMQPALHQQGIVERTRLNKGTLPLVVIQTGILFQASERELLRGRRQRLAQNQHQAEARQRDQEKQVTEYFHGC